MGSHSANKLPMQCHHHTGVLLFGWITVKGKGKDVCFVTATQPQSRPQPTSTEGRIDLGGGLEWESGKESGKNLSHTHTCARTHARAHARTHTRTHARTQGGADEK